MQTSSLPRDVVVQVLVFDPHGRAAGYRIFRDGRYESRTTDSGWAAGIAMTAGQMDAIGAAIKTAAPERLRARYAPEQPAGDDGGPTVQVDFALEQPPRAVSVVRPCEVPEVDGFIQRMAEIFKRP